MRQVGRPKISVGVNSRKTSSKDLIGLIIDYTEKIIFGYHRKNQSTIQEKDDLKSMQILTTYQLRFL